MTQIDIDACLAQETPDEFEVQLDDQELFGDVKPALIVKIEFSEFQKAYAQVYKPRMTGGKKRKEAMQFEIAGSDFDLGMKLADYVVGWKEFSGTFDKGKLVKFFNKFPTVCEAFGAGLGGIYKAKDAKYLKYKQDAEKN